MNPAHHSLVSIKGRTFEKQWITGLWATLCSSERAPMFALFLYFRAPLREKNYFKASSKTIIKSFSLTPLFSDSSHDTCLEVISSRITVHYTAQSLYIHTTYISPKDDVTIKPFPIVLYSFSLTVFTAAFILSSTHGLPNQTMTSNLFAFLLRFRGK